MLTMSDVAEGIGALAEGSLAARAVEPTRGENSDLTHTEDACANCGYTGAHGAFCPQCGQKMHVHRTLSAIGHDLLHGVLHLDGKFWSTLPLLVFKPGQLTRRYIEGERAKFVSPMAMFLFSVFAMFAIFQMVGLNTPTTIGSTDAQTTLLAWAVEEAREEVGRLETELEEDGLEEARRETLSGQLNEAKVGLAALESMGGESNVTETGSLIDLGNGGKITMESGPTGIAFIDEGLIKKWNENPGLMLYKLQANAYKFSWLLIPLSIPFVWLTFAWRRRFKAYDHAIFVTYSLSFMSLLFITASILGAAGAPQPLIVFPLLLIPPVHLYKQLRGAYGLRRLSAIWRLLALSLFIWIVVALFLQTLFILGAF